MNIIQWIFRIKIQLSTVFGSEPIRSSSLNRFVDLCTGDFTSLSNVRDKIKGLTSETHLWCFYMRENVFILCEIVFICAFLCEPSCLYVSIISTRVFFKFPIVCSGACIHSFLTFGCACVRLHLCLTLWAIKHDEWTPSLLLFTGLIFPANITTWNHFTCSSKQPEILTGTRGIPISFLGPTFFDSNRSKGAVKFQVRRGVTRNNWPNQ